VHGSRESERHKAKTKKKEGQKQSTRFQCIAQPAYWLRFLSIMRSRAIHSRTSLSASVHSSSVRKKSLKSKDHIRTKYYGREWGTLYKLRTLRENFSEKAHQSFKTRGFDWEMFERMNVHILWMRFRLCLNQWFVWFWILRVSHLVFLLKFAYFLIILCVF
jgi:hypothetical protein